MTIDRKELKFENNRGEGKNGVRHCSIVLVLSFDSLKTRQELFLSKTNKDDMTNQPETRTSIKLPEH